MSLYPPPQRLSPREWARMPERFHRKARTAWADADRGGATLYGFVEGPSFEPHRESVRHRHSLWPHLPHRAGRLLGASGCDLAVPGRALYSQ